MDLTVAADLIIKGKGKSLHCDTRNTPQRMQSDEDSEQIRRGFREVEWINQVYSLVGRKLASPSVRQ